MEERTYKIIAVDFDVTLSFGQWPDVGPANKDLIVFLKCRAARGDKLILWTSREGKELQDAVSWCSERGIHFDAVNDNLPETVQKYGNNSRKISYDYLIDDRVLMTAGLKAWKPFLREGVQ